MNWCSKCVKMMLFAGSKIRAYFLYIKYGVHMIIQYNLYCMVKTNQALRTTMINQNWPIRSLTNLIGRQSYLAYHMANNMDFM